MALSFVQYTGDGSQETFAIPFPYLQRENIEVRVSLDLTPYTWDDDNTIRISPAPANGAVIEARRVTPRENRLVDFVDGSVLTETDLDLANLQTFYIVQEAIDIAGGTLELLSDGSYGAGGRRIKELGNPIENRDAVTKEWAETAMSSQLSQATAEKALAVAARVAAEAARDAAAGSASGAASSASTATTQAGLADSSRAAAQAARDAALAYRDAALTYRNEAQGFRNEAETFKNNAAASAALAATFDPTNYVPKTGGSYTGQVLAPSFKATDSYMDMTEQSAPTKSWRLVATPGGLEFYYHNGSNWSLKARLGTDGVFRATDVGIL